MAKLHSVPFGTSFLLSGTAFLSIAVLSPSAASAACTFSPTAGNDSYVCDSGTSSGGLTDTGGNNVLLLPGGGTGTVNGNVTFGAGADRIEMDSGTIAGAVIQGDGADDFTIGSGVVTGNVQQGSGSDTFTMTGGQIGSLNQGDNIDTFHMSGGRIVDFFEDGDIAYMTGGRIGRVNMKLDDNLFDMSGGTIDGNLVTGFGNDTIILSNGLIGGNISVSGGTDSVTVTGGTIGGEVRMSVGNDTFKWDGGGIIYGLVDLGGDNDTAVLANLTNANMGDTPRISGGTGTDTLTFDNVKTGNVARFDSWESISLTNDSELVFDGTLTLGDSGTGTGTLSVDSGSTLYGGQANGAIASFAAGQLANVINGGRIDLTNGGNSTTDTFTIHGNYTGNNGEIFLNTVLGDDSSTSDKLVIDGGTASGQTGLAILNTGGSGAATTQDGIMVVQATNGGTTDSGAFALNGRVAAGAYEYFLFKGGVSANTGENWYLRSTLIPGSEAAATVNPVEPLPPAPQPEPPQTTPPPPPSEIPAVPLPSEGSATTDPVDPTPAGTASDPAPVAPPQPPAAAPADPPPPPPEVPTNPAPLPGEVSPPPGATPVKGDVVPLYRVEVPAYSVVPPAAQYLSVSTLGTFHERRGEQMLLNGGGHLPATWGRIYGQGVKSKWGGDVDPSFDGNLFGIQAGQDIFGHEGSGGDTDRLGFFIGYGHMDGDVRGQALGWNNLSVGDLSLNGTSLGAYWTHIGTTGWYLDAVLMGTWFDGHASANTGERIDLGGSAVTASLEGGYPIALGDNWFVEPQAQIVWNHLSLNDQADSFSTVTFDDSDSVTGRLGLRLGGNYKISGSVVQPYLKANIWHDFSSSQTVRFGGDPIVTRIGGTSLEIGGGVVTNLSKKVSLFATADYTTNLGGEDKRIWEANAGLSIKW
jgi:outer membrane autotransporter protein